MAPDIQFSIDGSDSNPFLEVYVNHEWAGMMDILRVGKFKKRSTWKRLECAADIATLAQHVKVKTGSKPHYIYQVVETDLMDEHHNKGVGRAMYEHALQELPNGGSIVLIPDYCAGGSTSVAARRVWLSLGRSYLSVGDVVASVKGTRQASPVRVAQRLA